MLLSAHSGFVVGALVLGAGIQRRDERARMVLGVQYLGVPAHAAHAVRAEHLGEVADLLVADVLQAGAAQAVRDPGVEPCQPRSQRHGQRFITRAVLQV